MLVEQIIDVQGELDRPRDPQIDRHDLGDPKVEEEVVGFLRPLAGCKVAGRAGQGRVGVGQLLRPP